MHERGHPAGLFIGDRAYLPNSKPEKLQYPLRAMGYGLCFDVRIDQAGIQAQHGGANLVEGHWFCPSMPDGLINATKLLRAGSITDDVYAQRIAQRTQYRFRPKSRLAWHRRAFSWGSRSAALRPQRPSCTRRATAVR